MITTLLLLASAISSDPEPGQSVRSANGEFIFRNYPAQALAAGEQGQVQFRAEVDEKGKVIGCKVTASSGFRRLDRETCQLIADHATFARVVDGSGKARGASHEGTVNWRIPGAAPTSAKMAASGGRNMDEVVCRKQLETGSLVKSSRRCMTRREWSRSAERNQNEWGELQGIKGSTREDQPTFPGGASPP
ncbi:energy transducer TonB [Sphingomonas sp. GCM10030256]|uniref:energy transducer TonB n=1 Tax=Sphingomonas sp. GCM10030256 TaxID=3273427 RepID=UPI00360814ED